ncbi:unnamed protein product [marine sediment metagenome]|uniref:Uncharacterized protein n=1 Tax=marine sediment metagenome TaxID=412755 RepID=X0RFJ7_9ZZZZ
MDDRLKTTNIGDTAIVDLNPQSPSFHIGEVKMISYRGINVSSTWGDKFVKWANVKEINKQKK